MFVGAAVLFLCQIAFVPSISGDRLQSLPTGPTPANATAMFRVTSDMASSLAMDGPATQKLVVNSVGDILRHEKLRRLKKVSRPLSWDGLCADFNLVETRRIYCHLLWFMAKTAAMMGRIK